MDGTENSIATTGGDTGGMDGEIITTGTIMPRPSAPRPSASRPPRPVIVPVRGGFAAAPQPDSARAESPAAPLVSCEIVQQSVTAAECDWLTHAEDRLAKGVASFAPPREMNRGETRTVRFSIAAGTVQAAADDIVGASGADGPVISMRNVRFGRYIEARLSGEGFTIAPPGRVLKDLYAAREGVWEWTVTALRAPRHDLRIEAWVRREKPDHTLGDVSYRAISPVTVTVPVRLYPDRIDDFLSDSTAWFGKGTNWLKALGVFIAAASAIWVALKGFGGKKPA